MKIITKEEFENISPRADSNLVVKAILKLELLSAIVIEKEEWTPKTDLAVYVARMKKRHNGMNWTVRKTSEGWAVQRIA